MSRVFRFSGRILLAACAAALFLGCGPKGVKTEGKILNSGSPYTPPSGALISLAFKGGEGGKDTYGAGIDQTNGTFKVAGPDGNGMPAGKYKIRLSATVGGTDPASLEATKAEAGKFAALNGQDVDIEAGKTIIIDIGNGSVKAQ